MEQTYVFFDIETTGLDPDLDDIIEVGAVKARRGEIIERFSTLIKPEGKLCIPPKIKNLTGIDEKMLVDAPSLTDVVDKFLDFLGDFPIVGHNISFDTGFLNKKLTLDISNPAIDTFEFVQFILPKAQSYRLEIVKDLLEIEEKVSHRALNDAETSCRIFFKCLELLAMNSSDVLKHVYRITSEHEVSLARVLTSYICEHLKTFPTIRLDTEFSYNNLEQSEHHSLFDSMETDNKKIEIDISGLPGFLEPSGPFAQKFPKYKYRDSQVKMLRTVSRGFQESKHMIIEAGTGTGKSIAYLIPAIGWAVFNSRKVVIATHTINLQEQLLQKDLPDIRETIGLDFKAALIKGRSNYLCLRRWEGKLRDNISTDWNEALFYMKVLIWLTGTGTGDKSEINILPRQYQYWNEISSDQDCCLGVFCSRYSKNCFVSKARRQAEAADLLIINHSLLFADIKVQNRLLPDYEYLVIDEAHHLENSATEQLGWSIGINNLRMALLSLTRGTATGVKPGLLNQLKQLFRNSAVFSQSETQRIDEIINEAFEKVRKINESIGEIDDFLRAWLAKKNNSEYSEDIYQVIRIRQEDKGEESWKSFVSIKDNFVSRSVGFTQSLKKLSGAFENLDREQQKEFMPIVKDIEFQVEYLTAVNINLEVFLHGSEEHVLWIEAAKGPKADVIIKCAPISVSKLLHDNLFQANKSILLTSATLSVDGSFEHFSDRIGLSLFSEDEIIMEQYTSPFEYERQVLLCIARDLPDPTAVREDDYIQEVSPVIADLARLFKGRTLVLFTSNRMLREVYARVQPQLEAEGLTVLGHKIDGGRTRLVSDFRRNTNTVLFGTSSFWEGIDLPGGALKCVVIVKLPFAPPTSPIVEARIEELVKIKKDAFYSYTVPDAVIKLKQGFGRLIRSEDDEGVVVLLDRRVVERKYGRKFLNSLPVKTHFKADSASVLQKIRDWVQGEKSAFSSSNILDSIGDLEKYLRNSMNRKKK